MTYPPVLFEVADYSWDRPDPVELAKRFRGVIRYAPGRADAVNITAAEVKTLEAAGLGIGIVIQPAKDWALGGFDRGVAEAKRSVEMTRAAGLPDGDVFVAVDFDATRGGPPTSAAALADMAKIAATFNGVASVVGREHVRPYGGYYTLAWLFQNLTWLKAGWQTRVAWSVNPDTGALMLHPKAAVVQHSPSITYAGGLIDHNDVLLLPEWVRHEEGGTMPEVWIPEAEDLKPVGYAGTMSGVGGPRATLHCTVSPSGYASGGEAYFDRMHRVLTSKEAEPHLLYDGQTDRLGQYFPLDKSARALMRGTKAISHNKLGTRNIQIELVAMPEDWSRPDSTWNPGKNFRAMMRAIRSNGVHDVVAKRFARTAEDRPNVVIPWSTLASSACSGVWLGHCNYPDGETHWDPVGPTDFSAQWFGSAPVGSTPIPPPSTTTPLKEFTMVLVQVTGFNAVVVSDGVHMRHVASSADLTRLQKAYAAAYGKSAPITKVDSLSGFGEWVGPLPQEAVPGLPTGAQA